MAVNASQVSTIREMLADGATDEYVLNYLAEDEENRIDSLVADRERIAMYGDEWRRGCDVAMNDRLDMGRNDAGEWLGFM